MIAFDVALTTLVEAIFKHNRKAPVIFVRKQLGDGDFSALQEARQREFNINTVEIALVSVAVIAPAKTFKHNSTIVK